MMRSRSVLVAFFALVLGSSATTIVACDDGAGNAVKEPIIPKDGGALPVDSGGQSGDGGTLPDGAPSDCFMNPQTHFEIINACTDSVRIAKSPNLPLLSPDGGLPPLP